MLHLKVRRLESADALLLGFQIGNGPADQPLVAAGPREQVLVSRVDINPGQPEAACRDVVILVGKDRHAVVDASFGVAQAASPVGDRRRNALADGPAEVEYRQKSHAVVALRDVRALGMFDVSKLVLESVNDVLQISQVQDGTGVDVLVLGPDDHTDGVEAVRDLDPRVVSRADAHARRAAKGFAYEGLGTGSAFLEVEDTKDDHHLVVTSGGTGVLAAIHGLASVAGK